MKPTNTNRTIHAPFHLMNFDNSSMVVKALKRGQNIRFNTVNKIWIL